MFGDRSWFWNWRSLLSLNMSRLGSAGDEICKANVSKKKRTVKIWLV